jgi:hypothetical protein
LFAFLHFSVYFLDEMRSRGLQLNVASAVGVRDATARVMGRRAGRLWGARQCAISSHQRGGRALFASTSAPPGDDEKGIAGSSGCVTPLRDHEHKQYSRKVHSRSHLFLFIFMISLKYK